VTRSRLVTQQEGRPQGRPFFARGAAWGCAGRAVGAALALLASATPVWAQPAAPRPVHRCPGPPVLYTDVLSPEQARARGCQVLEAGPLTVGVGAAPSPAAGRAPDGGTPPAGDAARPPARADTRIDPAVQRSRDAEARRILEAELRREEQQLEQLRRDFSGGEPERRGDERNYARYQQRVDEMRTAIARKEADVAAIRRELARLRP
jgi:hypothetical protein